jgi:hypothetical protein
MFKMIGLTLGASLSEEVLTTMSASGGEGVISSLLITPSNIGNFSFKYQQEARARRATPVRTSA